jgi:2-phospho-L-lactate guanylyltransferase (CobY/MobA/RfbA family)
MPPTQFTYRYGLGSFRSHIQEATRLGLDVHIIHAPGLRFDLDTEEDWQQYQHELTVQL